MTSIASVLATLVGITLGLLGGGGSILALPIFVYALDIDEAQAIAMSLLVVGITSAFAVLPHAKAGNIAWRTGGVFGGFGMAGAYAGGLLAAFVPPTLLMLGFAVLMVGASIAMMRGRKTDGEPKAAGLPFIALEGIVVGLLTGLVGAGGGFMIVPALVVFGGLDMKKAVGTSLFVISIKSAAGFAGHLQHVEVDWALSLGFAGFSVIGAFIGALFARCVDAAKLKVGFGVFVLVIASVMLTNMALEHLAVAAAWPALLAGAIALGLGTLLARRLAVQA
ncbi:MAG: putative membrane protein YfcA [Flavobacteriales bacterium]|jgi:uncharacterized membrane protein YfcA